MRKLRVLDLFSGIGGFSLGLERTGGFETVAFCEIEEFPRRVLAKHWPEVPCYHDVRELTADTLRRDGIEVDVICGGFPCQDISRAGSGAGIGGARSGLWSEYARIIGEVRPEFVLVENVSTLLHRGMDAVLGSLAALGYDAEWDCIPASNIGAPHIRDRLWLVAYAQHSDADSLGPHRAKEHHRRVELCDKQGRVAGPLGSHVADAHGEGQSQPRGRKLDIGRWLVNGREEGRRRWGAEPRLGRVADGVPDRAHRLKGLGNAVVPQIPELIGRAILQSMEEAA